MSWKYGSVGSLVDLALKVLGWHSCCGLQLVWVLHRNSISEALEVRADVSAGQSISVTLIPLLAVEVWRCVQNGRETAVHGP